MKTLIITLLSFLLFASPALAADRQQERLDRAHNMANTTLAVLADPDKSFHDREALLKNSFAKVVDIEWIAKFVLGNTWRSANETQRKHYVRLYRNYLTKTYVENFAQNSNRKITDIRVLGVNSSESENYTARTELVLSTGERMNVDYLVNENTEGKHRIVDIIIENVSLLATHRAQFRQLATQGGIEKVIAKLEALTQPTITLSMK